MRIEDYRNSIDAIASRFKYSHPGEISASLFKALLRAPVSHTLDRKMERSMVKCIVNVDSCSLF